jgi:aminopeptidase N
MKHLFTLLFLFTGILCAQAQTPFGPAFTERLACRESEAAALQLQQMGSLPGTEYDAKYHRAHWEVDPNVRYIKGAVTTYLVSRQAGLDTLSFSLSHLLTVDSVRYHGATAPFTLAADELRIGLPAPVALGMLDSVSIYYQGNPPQTGFGSFVKSQHNSGKIIWTLSDPFGGKDWWPCKMTLDDKIDSLDLFITTPQINKAGSNGKLISADTIGTNIRYHWQHRYPITSYLVCMAVSNYVGYSHFVPLGQDTLEVLNYVYPQHLSYAQNNTPGIGPILQLYDTLFTPYPFMGEKYGHAEFGWGGGMEHQTMSFMTNFTHDLMAHECAHQWFGNKITCGSWRDMWLNEGWATYVAALTLERQPQFTPQDWMTWKTQTINSVTSGLGGAVQVPDSSNINRIFDSRLTYDKGALLLHMLRWVVGDSAFFAGTKSYLNDPQLAYDYARTIDFRQHLEQASGMNLQEFFNDWFVGQGFPRYQVQWLQDATGQVTLTLGQTQSHVSVSFFEMPVPVRFSNGVQDTVMVFNHTSSGQTFTFNPGFVVSTVQLDPERWLVQKGSVISNVTARPEDLLAAAVQVFPNPAKDQLRITLPGNSGPVQVLMTDAFGRTVFTTFLPVSSTPVLEVRLPQLPAGMYDLHITGGAFSATRPVVVLP